MNGNEDSDVGNDSSYESDLEGFVDSDKANSDLEIELYGQIFYSRNIDASTTESLPNGDVIEVSPIKNVSLLSPTNPKEKIIPEITLDSSQELQLNHFESTPKNLIKEKELTKTHVFANAKENKKNVVSATGTKTSKKSRKSACTKSVIIYSNDDSDDSVILIDSDDHCDSSSLVTNIQDHLNSEEMIVLESIETSDEDFDDRSSSPSDFENSIRLSTSVPSSVKGRSGDIWQIDHEDRYAHMKKWSNRYHQEKRSQICNNCKKKGHLSKDCTEPRNMRCYICGHDHVWSMCYQKICGICFEYGHITENCRYNPCDVQCNLCKMRGHLVQDCPDIWRRYHLTTSPKAIVKASKKSSARERKYCYNCGNEGHYGHECLRPRMLPESFPTWPFIISYKDPAKYIKKHFKRLSNGEIGGTSRRDHYSHPKHKRSKPQKSKADKLREIIQRKHKRKSKNAGDDPIYGGGGFPRTPHVIDMIGGVSNSKKTKSRADQNSNRLNRKMRRLLAFKRKKQMLNSTV